MSSYIPQRVKRAKQQITVKLFEDRLAMLDHYGRFIEDSRDYIIDQALDLVFKKDKDFLQWLEQKSRNATSGNDVTATENETARVRLNGQGGWNRPEPGAESAPEPATQPLSGRVQR
jgi:hypothetical protein